MVLSWYKIRTTGRRLRVLLGTTGYGTPAPRLHLLERLNVRVEYRSARDESEIARALADGIPPICLVMTGALPYWHENVGHALVVVDIQEDWVIVNDPAFAGERQRIPLDAFLLAWVEQDNMIALITPR